MRSACWGDRKSSALPQNDAFDPNRTSGEICVHHSAGLTNCYRIWVRRTDFEHILTAVMRLAVFAECSGIFRLSAPVGCV